MKTAQEILDEYFEKNRIMADREHDYIDDKGVHEVIEEAMQEYAKQVALAFYYSEESLTPEQMNSNYDRFAEREGLV